MKVEFTVTQYMLQSGKVVQALRDVFGERAARYANFAGELIITCRADQLVVFLVQRDRLGAKNDWMGLKTKIIDCRPSVPALTGREAFV